MIIIDFIFQFLDLWKNMMVIHLWFLEITIENHSFIINTHNLFESDSIV